MLIIECSKSYCEEIKYIINVIFDDWLEIPYKIVYGSRKDFIIRKDDRELVLKSTFFEEVYKKDNEYLESISDIPLWDSNDVKWNISLVEEKVPVLFGRANIEDYGEHIIIWIDILGSAFFMLTRYEELMSQYTDKFGRYPVASSMAFRRDFLMRPIIDEYVEILWAAMQRLWPELERNEHAYEITPTHDVDDPFLNLSIPNIKTLIRRVAGDLIRRKSFVQAFNTIIGWLGYKAFGNLRYKKDVYDTFNRIMDLSEKAGLKSSFNFMTCIEEGIFGGRYDIGNENIIDLIVDISKRGHIIGFHPTGTSYLDENIFNSQAVKFKNTLTSIGIEVDFLGGRQHYLLWSPGKTHFNWKKSGFSFDSTLGYAEHVGFRCGTCKEFSFWDHINKQKMALKERPLIMMESSLLSEEYMGMSLNEAKKTILYLKNACKVVRGNFVFLWHNSHFLNSVSRQLFTVCISRTNRDN